MTEDEVYRIAMLSIHYDAYAFIWAGATGLQPVLLPRKVFSWPKDELSPVKRSRNSSRRSGLE